MHVCGFGDEGAGGDVGDGGFLVCGYGAGVDGAGSRGGFHEVDDFVGDPVPGGDGVEVVDCRVAHLAGFCGGWSGGFDFWAVEYPYVVLCFLF